MPRLSDMIRSARASAKLSEALARSASHWLGWKHEDNGPERSGLRAGVVQELALSAFASGRIDRVREYLKLPLTEPLPEHSSLTAENRAPVRRIEDTVRGVAQRYLQEQESPYPDDGGFGCIATTVSREQGGFRVDVEGWADATSSQTIPCGFLRVSHDLVVTGAHDLAQACVERT